MHPYFGYMTHEDPIIIDHEKREMRAKARRWIGRGLIVFGAMILIMWFSDWYFFGWESINWRSVVLGALTMAAIFLSIVHYIDLRKPYRENFK